MTTMMKASLPTEQFALADTFEAVPDVEFDAARLVSHGTDRVVPLLWATGADASAVYEAIENDDTTTDTRLVSRRNHDALFQLRWTSDVRSLTHALVAERGAMLGAHGTSEKWTFRIVFPDRDAVSATYDACGEHDIEVEQLTGLAESPLLGGFRLTDEQFTTVEAAVDSGYYDIPRQTTLAELATDLDVSHQALSERLRRGHRTLIESVLAPRGDATRR